MAVTLPLPGGHRDTVTITIICLSAVPRLFLLLFLFFFLPPRCRLLCPVQPRSPAAQVHCKDVVGDDGGEGHPGDAGTPPPAPKGVPTALPTPLSHPLGHPPHYEATEGTPQSTPPRK